MTQKNLSHDVIGLVVNRKTQTLPHPQPVNPRFRKVSRKAYPNQKLQYTFAFSPIAPLIIRQNMQDQQKQKCRMSSYQLYKRKQKDVRQKLQNTQITNNYSFYCTVRHQESRSYRRREKAKISETSLPMRSIKSQIHNRSLQNRDSSRAIFDEECKIITTGNRKGSKCFSLEIGNRRKKQQFTIRKKKFPTYRPWSPSQQENQGGHPFLTDSQTIL